VLALQLLKCLTKVGVPRLGRPLELIWSVLLLCRFKCDSKIAVSLGRNYTKVHQENILFTELFTHKDFHAGIARDGSDG
jgi:hypothetical protein